MNLHFFGSAVDPTHNEANDAFEHAESVVFSTLAESLDEGGEYADDVLRMTEQPFGQD